MIKLLVRVAVAVPILLSGCNPPDERLGIASASIIFGQDDRVETYTLASDSLGAKVARFSAALVDASRLDLSDPSDVRLMAPALRERVGLCADERFGEQPTAAYCSGTLVTEELLVTAGHCIDAASCTQTRVVLGYAMRDESSLETIAADRVFSCAEVVVREYASDIDYAVIRLDRPVSGTDLPRLKVGALPLAIGQAIVVAGHPTGLPQKIAAGATVIDARSEVRDFFVTDLDVFPGNSGSGVFGQDTGEMVGVLVRGPNPGYVVLPGETCVRPERADPSNGNLIESVYLHQALQGFCAVAQDARLCACGDGVCDPPGDETTASCPSDCGTFCGDGECNGIENGDDCYDDCGACGNRICEAEEVSRMNCTTDCGCPPGMTIGPNRCVPLRGNVNGDHAIDQDDLLSLKRALSSPGSTPMHADAADVNCDGLVDETDEQALDDFVRGNRSLLPCETVQELSLGTRHSCALLGGGNVRCWGANSFGQLGLGATTNVGDLEPASHAAFINLGGPVQHLSAGATHNCALLTDGNVTCWGEGARGKLGYGDVQNVGDDERPNQRGAVELGGRAIFVAAGGGHSCAVLENGSVRCWGSNSFGQLGYGQPQSIGDDESPGSVAPLQFATSVKQLGLGFDHSCALTADGNVYCWGSNLLGQLGRGSRLGGGPLERADQVAPVALGGKVRKVVAGHMTTCAIREDDAVFCWGANQYAQLGYGHTRTIGDDETPLSVGPAPLGASVRELVLAQRHTCALYAEGSVRCWGYNEKGELGYGNTLPIPSTTTPDLLSPVLIGGTVERLGTGASHTCAVIQGGALRCWGVNESGQLGYGHTRSVGATDTPASVGDVPAVPASTPGWHFVNPFRLEVWTLDESSDQQSSGIAIYVANRGETTISSFRALYSFRTDEIPGETPALQDHYTPWSTPRIEAEQDGLNTLILDFDGQSLPPGQDSSWGNHGGEKYRIHFSDWRTGWLWQNDYSATDQHPRGAWHVTERVQLVDQDGSLIYGWTPR